MGCRRNEKGQGDDVQVGGGDEVESGGEKGITARGASGLYAFRPVQGKRGE